MKPCTRVGIDCTKRCNWKCQTCFYRYRQDFNTPYDKSVPEVMNEALSAKNRGCDHVVFVGYGEPTLWPNLVEAVKEIKNIGMTSSIITNGSASIKRYADLREAGLNHLHVSVHGLGKTLNEISGYPIAGEVQNALLRWLKKQDWPWRMNMTVQRCNYKYLPVIAEHCLAYGCRHIVSLGFLPHYEWNDPNKLREVAVHPKELQEYIEMVVDLVEKFNGENPDREAMMTIRYHPMCHLKEEYRKYVTNALYVLYCEYEWDYGNAGLSPEALWTAAKGIGGTVSIESNPCSKCGLKIHCGGWNKVYAAGFNGADLCAIDMPEETKVPGWLFDQNPQRRISNGKGWF